MSHHIMAYPLAWPPGWLRTPDSERTYCARFHIGGHPLTLEAARDRLDEQLRKLKVGSAILSTNAPLRADGGIRRDAKSPADGGAALYFRRRQQAIALAADRFSAVANNVGALAAYLEALRATERHGVGNLDRVFAGYLALPAPESWTAVLENPSSLAEAEATYRRLAKAAHERHGGEAGDARIKELNIARDAARKAFAA